VLRLPMRCLLSVMSECRGCGLETGRLTQTTATRHARAARPRPSPREPMQALTSPWPHSRPMLLKVTKTTRSKTTVPLPGAPDVVCGNTDTKDKDTTFICLVKGLQVRSRSLNKQTHKGFTQIQSTWRLTNLHHTWIYYLVDEQEFTWMNSIKSSYSGA
jgi:hypothetical protein